MRTRSQQTAPRAGKPTTFEENEMNDRQFAPRPLARALAVAALAFGAQVALAEDVKVALSGDQEVPAVSTQAKGSGTISVKDDKTVSGAITVSGLTPTAAHIHEGAAGKNGGVIIPLTKSGDGFSVPAGAKLTDAQYEAFKKGDLYVNVHTAAHPGGEIRAQLKP
jgi:hypothetical protein